MKKNGISLSVISICCTLSFGQPAFSKEQGKSITLEEIVVTAQKRAQSMQDVPIAISAFDAKSLRDGGFNDIADISQQVPSLSVNTHFAYSNPKIYLRGVGNNEYQANAVGAVAVYQDDVYLAAASGQLFQFYDLEAVEVLRGPQGTLYGKNTTGGALAVRSRRPGQEFEGDLSVSFGNFSSVDIEGGVSFPLIENKLAARVSYTSNSRDGFIENTFVDEGGLTRNDDGVNDRNSTGSRVLFVYTPSEDLTIDFNFHQGSNKSTALQGEAFALVDTNGDGSFDDVSGFANPNENPDPFIQSYNLDISENLEASGASLKVDYSRGGLNFKSITAVEDVSRNSREDVDQTPVELLEIEWDNESSQFSQEFQISNNNQDSKINWIAGGYYFDDNIVVGNTYDLARFAAPANLVVSQSYEQDTDSVGVFGQLTYAASNDMNFTFGLRFTDETREWEGVSSITNLGLDTIPFQTQEESWSSTSFRFATDYKLDENKLIYASYNRGFKAGGFNGGAITTINELGPFDQEQLDAYEIGFKSDLLDNRMRLNLTAFYYDYKDLQIFTLETPANEFGLPIPLQIINNAESAENYGLELELDTYINDNVKIGLDAAYLSTEIGTFVRPNGDFTGNEIGNSPSYDVSLSLDYSLPVAQGAVNFHLDMTATDDRFFDPSNTQRVLQEAYQLFNARVSYAPEDSNWELSAWVKNLTDEEYYVEIIPIDGFAFDERFIGDPSTYGVKFSFNF